jgi:hypothetical protein
VFSVQTRRAALPRALSVVLLIMAPMLALGATALPVSAAESSTQILRVPLNQSFFVPCANDGAGEVVTLSGTFTMVFHTTVDPDSGTTHITSVEFQSGVRGFGETTGDRYVSTFVNFFNFNDSSALTSTQQVNYRITGPGRGNDALIRIVNHSTVNPDGKLTVAFDEITIVCEATAP